MDFYGILNGDEQTAQERQRAIAAELRRNRAAGMVAAMSGNKLLAPVAQQLTRGAEQGQQDLQQVAQQRTMLQRQQAAQEAEQQRYQEQQAYRQQRDAAEDQFRRQQLAKQGQAPAPQMLIGADGMPYFADPRTGQARPVTGPDGQPFRGQRPGKTPDQAKIASDLRRELQGQSVYKNAQEVETQFAKIMGTGESGAGDMSLIFAYMKMLDPGSTVREGEYATAQNAGSLPQNIVAAYNKTVSGEKLAPGVREMFKGEARKVRDAQLGRYRAVADQYRRLAEQAGVSPDDVDLGSLNGPKRIASDAEYAALPSGTQYLAPDGSVRTKR